MEREAKAMVVAFGGQNLINPYWLAVSPWSHGKNWLDSSYFSKTTQAKQLARLGFEQILPPKQTGRPLPSLLSPSFFYGGERNLKVCKLNCSFKHILDHYIFNGGQTCLLISPTHTTQMETGSLRQLGISSAALPLSLSLSRSLFLQLFLCMSLELTSMAMAMLSSKGQA